MRALAVAFREWLNGLSGPTIATASLALVVVVASADVAAGEQVGFSIFYLMPVLLAAWLGARVTIVVVAAAAGAAFPISEILIDVVYRDAWIPYWNFVSRSGTYLVVGFLSYALRATIGHEQQLARTDSLTGALNSRSFEEAALVEISRARRSNRAMTVAYLDLDGFKAVNDDFGHHAGDELLLRVAQVLRAETRPADVVARLGGDEFALLLPDTDEQGSGATLERVRAAIQSLAAGAGYRVSVSVGAATFDRPPETVDELIWPADQLMYSAKRSGKDAIRHRTFASGAREELTEV